MKLMRIIVVISTCIMVVACGFTLRGSRSLPAGYEFLQVESVQRHTPLKRALNKRLEIYDISSTQGLPYEEQSTITITLAPEKLERRLLSVFSTGQVAEYELILGVSYTVQFGQQDIIDAFFEVVRDYQDDPDEVLAKSRELELVLSEMRREAADRIIRRLSSQSSVTQ